MCVTNAYKITTNIVRYLITSFFYTNPHARYVSKKNNLHRMKSIDFVQFFFFL